MTLVGVGEAALLGAMELVYAGCTVLEGERQREEVEEVLRMLGIVIPEIISEQRPDTSPVSPPPSSPVLTSSTPSWAKLFIDEELKRRRSSAGRGEEGVGGGGGFVPFEDQDGELGFVWIKDSHQPFWAATHFETLTASRDPPFPTMVC